MRESAYLFRRSVYAILAILWAIYMIAFTLSKLDAHVDLVHVEVDTIVREIMQEIQRDQEKAIRELAGNDFGHYEEGNEPGVKHD